MKSPSRGRISDPSQLRVLASPARQELLDLLARVGPASVAEIGRLIGKPADGLYYHLRALQKVGLLRPAGTRTRAGRSEALFRTVHRRPTLLHDPSPRGNSRAVTAIVASMLRLGIRDFRRAASSASVRTEGPKRELWALRVTGWLRQSDLVVVNRRVRALSETPGRPRADRKLYGITILLTPLSHRARKKRRNRRTGPGRGEGSLM